jgi:hypothetical protein
MTRQTLTLQGFMPAGREKFYHNVSFEMPPGVSRLEVSYAYSDAIGSDPHLTGGNTVDIGLFDWRGADFLNAGFRGWSGSARSEFFITPTDATPGYLPGPLTAGTWYICLGFYKVGPRGCDYLVEITMEQGETAAADFPPMLTLQSPNAHIPARPDGWYKGELHCHTVHSDGDSCPADVIAAAQALGLDFLAITDHNNITHLAELAAMGPQKLILIPGYEVTMYSGHWNVWGPETWVDFRVISPKQMQRALDFAADHVYLASCNHPRQFGPMWEYGDVQGYQCVEVWNGPWRLLNDQSLAFWEERLRQGQRLSAVGGSDMHRLQTEHHARIGTPTTWIHCCGQPTAAALLDGLRAGHAFISAAPDGPQLYLTVNGAMMGDAVSLTEQSRLDVQARVIGGAGLTLELHSAQGCIHTAPVEQDEQVFDLSLNPDRPLYIRAQVVELDEDNRVVHTLTNPVYIVGTSISA